MYKVLAVNLALVCTSRVGGYTEQGYIQRAVSATPCSYDRSVHKVLERVLLGGFMSVYVRVGEVEKGTVSST
jgi:hypothetical protein